MLDTKLPAAEIARLTPEKPVTGRGSVLINHAIFVEDALLYLGAKPGKDYTILDLIKLANESYCTPEIG